MRSQRSEPDVYYNERLQAPRFVLGAPDTSTGCNPASQPSTRQALQSKRRDYRFSIVTDPTERTSRSEMQAIRRHVMKDFFNTSGGDPRIKRGQKRGTSRHESVKACTSLDSGDRATSKATSMTLSSATRQVGTDTYMANQDWLRCLLCSSGRSCLSQPQQAIIWKGAKNVIYRPLLFSGDATLYCASKMTDVLSLPSDISTSIDPFDSWPSSLAPAVPLERFEWICAGGLDGFDHKLHAAAYRAQSYCRRCNHLTQDYIPALMGSSSAFYSSLCVLSGYNDVMAHELLPLDKQNGPESYFRTALRQRVLRMIRYNISRDDIGDGSVIAIFHILHSEFMTADSKSIHAHQAGLDEMVRNRGGLNNLGLHGFLAKFVVM